MFEQYLPSIASSYTWFFYLGIILFVSHTLLYGFGIDMSYFGILLIYIGWTKPQIYPWLRTLLWVFVIIDLLANARVAYDRILGIKEDDMIIKIKEGNKGTQETEPAKRKKTKKSKESKSTDEKE